MVLHLDQVHHLPSQLFLFPTVAIFKQPSPLNHWISLDGTVGWVSGSAKHWLKGFWVFRSAISNLAAKCSICFQIGKICKHKNSLKRAKTTNFDICEISEKCEISVDALSEAFNTFQKTMYVFTWEDKWKKGTCSTYLNLDFHFFLDKAKEKEHSREIC